MTRTDAAPLVVAITGATAGVGRATARAFARRGAHIGLLARGADRLDATAREVEALGGRAVVVSGDVANPDDLERLAAETESAFGPLDVWVNNAMATIYGEVHEVEPDEFKRATEVTYLGQVYGAQAALRRMRPRDAGTIVFVGSSLAHRGIPLQSAYCGAKHAVQGFFESLRSELIHQESAVTVTMVQLPALNTPQFGWARTKRARTPRPAGTVYAPEVAADAIVFAATDGRGRREIWVGASTVQAIVANRVAPGLLDHYVARTLYEGETTDEPVAADRADNLFEPVGGDPGAEGSFGGEARHTSPQLWATKHRRLVFGAALLAVAALTARRRS
jgi:NAD(P)-dependent dehydrogenase (short-subunit alcohol dehydrogenase family)